MNLDEKPILFNNSALWKVNSVFLTNPLHPRKSMLNRLTGKTFSTTKKHLGQKATVQNLGGRILGVLVFAVPFDTPVRPGNEVNYNAAQYTKNRVDVGTVGLRLRADISIVPGVLAALFAQHDCLLAPCSTRMTRPHTCV